MQHCDRKLDFCEKRRSKIRKCQTRGIAAQISKKIYGNEDIYTRYCIKNFEENPMSSFAIKIQEKFEKELS